MVFISSCPFKIQAIMALHRHHFFICVFPYILEKETKVVSSFIIHSLELRVFLFTLATTQCQRTQSTLLFNLQLGGYLCKNECRLEFGLSSPILLSVLIFLTLSTHSSLTLPILIWFLYFKNIKRVRGHQIVACLPLILIFNLVHWFKLGNIFEYQISIEF